jgi:lactoylglutathione lyase
MAIGLCVRARSQPETGSAACGNGLPPILFSSFHNRRSKACTEERLAKAIHTMIRVLDEARSVDFYGKAFGLKVAERLDFETFTLLYLGNAETEFELELTINKGRAEPYSFGDGYGHLAVTVANLDAEHERLGGLGLNPKNIVEFNRDGTLFARFFFIEDPDGYRIEVLQRHGRYK